MLQDETSRVRRVHCGRRIRLSGEIRVRFVELLRFMN